jgi:hypothetical protein
MSNKIQQKKSKKNVNSCAYQWTTTLVSKAVCQLKVVTQAKQQFGRKQIFCKSGSSAGTIIFALQKTNKQLSLLIPFRQDTFSNQTVA